MKRFLLRNFNHDFTFPFHDGGRRSVTERDKATVGNLKEKLNLRQSMTIIVNGIILLFILFYSLHLAID